MHAVANRHTGSKSRAVSYSRVQDTMPFPQSESKLNKRQPAPFPLLSKQTAGPPSSATCSTNTHSDTYTKPRNSWAGVNSRPTFPHTHTDKYTHTREFWPLAVTSDGVFKLLPWQVVRGSLACNAISEVRTAIPPAGVSSPFMAVTENPAVAKV